MITTTSKVLKALIKEILQGKIVILTEGGEAFPGQVNSLVPKSLLSKSIENALELADLSGIKYEIVGNKNREYFGDIDVGVDEDEIRSFLGLDRKAEIKQVWASIDEHLKKSNVMGHRIIPGLSQIHLLVPLVDEMGVQVNAIDKNGNELEIPGMIQIDLFVGHLGWMSATSSGAPIDSKYKAVYRNILLASIFANVPVDPTPEEVAKYSKSHPGVEIKKRFLTNFRKGLIERIYYEEKIGKSGKPVKNPAKIVLEERFVTDADELGRYFLRGSTSWSDIDSYERLMSLMKSKKFLYPSLRQKIVDDFKRGLGDNPIPTDVQN